MSLKIRFIVAALAATMLATSAFAARRTKGAVNEPAGCITHLTFDKSPVDFDLVDRMQSSNSIARAADTYTVSPGLKGNALDLTDMVANRIPFVLDSASTPDYDKSFAFSIWVQTKPGARQGTPIMTNKKYYRPRLEVHREYRNICDEMEFPDQSKTPGLMLGTTDLGGWYLHLCDTTTWYAYTPTVERQRINDGRWHNITASVDFDRGEMWIYFDGKNVAVYNMPDLKSARGTHPTFVGGSDDFTELSHNYSRGERNAFNGRIDEVKFWNRPVTSEEVAAEYAEYFPDADGKPESDLPLDRLRVQAWNIWHGGGRFGEHVGLARVAEVLKSADADLIGIVEAYGSGPVLADSLGYHFYFISDNLGILSRYPIESTIQLYRPQRSGGVIVDLPGDKKVAFFDIWLDWHWNTDSIRSVDIRGIRPVLSQYAANADKVPVIAVGDYNSGSHLDKFGYRVYGAKRVDNPAISWPSKVMVDDLGFHDSFRQLYPDSELYPGSTWTPLYNGMRNIVPNRVDFIYYKGGDLKPYFTETFAHHGVQWPSDHASVVTDFFLR